MKKYTALLLALLLTLSLTACGQTEDTGDTEWEYPAAFAGLETLVEQAQAEGSLTVYGSCPAAYLTAACETFETLFNIRVSYQQVSDQAVLDKLPTAKIVDRCKGGYVVEAEVYGDGIRMWILSQGDWVKVIGPEEFVEEVRGEIEKVCKIYARK